VGLEKDVEAVNLARLYLSRLVDFASNREVRPLKITDKELEEIPSARRYQDTINALMSYKNFDTGINVNRVDKSDPSTMVERVEALVKASNEIVDIVGAIELNNIKQEIVRTIDVDEEFVPILSERTNYGVESATLEFKTSIVFAPLNRQGKAGDNFQKWAILKTICGFLNSRLGGELILGVNDGGYAQGVATDIEELFRQQLIAEPTLDRYRIYVQNVIDYAFTDTMMPDITPPEITVLNVNYETEINDEGKELLHIQVKPYPYGVVRFRSDIPRPDDFAESYVRRSGSTMPRTPNLEKEILDYKNKALASSSTETMIKDLGSAIAEKKVVVLKDYASRSGIRDRLLEPYKIWTLQGLVYGYDRGAKAARLYKLSRCSQVLVTSDGWSDYKCSTNVRLDPFGLLVNESEATDVVLLLSSYASRLLSEEHPEARVDSNPDPRSRDEFPYEMRCRVSELEGVARFCLSLPGEVQVVKGNGLADYISSKAQRLIKL
ncbi:MAG: WYL domain-containing protein, partial [Duncaniella sp.]|nr:WYL domain-containing protein [Duncaniella sp.]